jgi:hypothetical protein
VAGHPLRPATDRRLGKPLPYQLANQTQAVPKAHKALLRRAHAVLDTISGAYPSLWGTFLRVTHPSAARVSYTPYSISSFASQLGNRTGQLTYR